MADGVHGNVSTLNPVLSPTLWTSIGTGKRPYKHGIHGFSEPTPDGKGDPSDHEHQSEDQGGLEHAQPGRQEVQRRRLVAVASGRTHRRRDGQQLLPDRAEHQERGHRPRDRQAASGLRRLGDVPVGDAAGRPSIRPASPRTSRSSAFTRSSSTREHVGPVHSEVRRDRPGEGPAPHRIREDPRRHRHHPRCRDGA